MQALILVITMAVGLPSALADQPARLTVGTRLEVQPGETVGGDVVAAGGDVRVAGTVRGDVIALGGHVELPAGAKVTGDVVAAGGNVWRDPGASVDGKVVSIANAEAGALLRRLLPTKLASGTQVAEPPSDGQRVGVGRSVAVKGGETVSGDVVVIGDDAKIEGAVNGAVVVVGGDLELGEGAVVGGDAVCLGGALDRADGATVRGNVVSVETEGLSELIGERVEAASVSRPAEAPPAPPAPPTPPVPPTPPQPPAPPSAEKHQGPSRQASFGGVVVGRDEVVNGDVTANFGPVEILGEVTGNVTTSFGELHIGDGAKVRGNVTAGFANTRIGSNADIGGNCTIGMGEVSIGPHSRIGGNLTVAGEAQIDPTATIVGTRTIGPSVPVVPPFWPRPPGLPGLGWWIPAVVLVVTLLLLQVLFVGASSLVAPTFTRQTGQALRQRPGPSVGAAFLSVLLMLPISVVLAVLVCIGWPFLALYWILLLLLIVAGLSGLCLLIGEWVAQRLHLNVTSVPGLAVLGAIALLPLDVLIALPVVGCLGWIALGAMLFLAHGGGVLTFINSRRPAAVTAHVDQPAPGVWTAEVRAESPEPAPTEGGSEAVTVPDATPGEPQSVVGAATPIVTTQPRIVVLEHEVAPPEAPAAEGAGQAETTPAPTEETSEGEATSSEGEPPAEGPPLQSPAP